MVHHQISGQNFVGFTRVLYTYFIREIVLESVYWDEHSSSSFFQGIGGYPDCSHDCKFHVYQGMRMKKEPDSCNGFVYNCVPSKTVTTYEGDERRLYSKFSRVKTMFGKSNVTGPSRKVRYCFYIPYSSIFAITVAEKYCDNQTKTSS
jgi:hypothetical protein